MTIVMCDPYGKPITYLTFMVGVLSGVLALTRIVGDDVLRLVRKRLA